MKVRETSMNKDDMINSLLRDIEADRFLVAGSDSPNSAELEHLLKAEWSRLDALTYGEIEARYFNSEEVCALSLE